MSDSGCQTQLARIECDGRMISMARDPPGQRSVYILPGDTERETYRLATFKDFPSNVPVDVRRLASGGFYFTGYKDRVKCFSCGQCVENWNVEDDPTSHVWHKPDCDLITGRDERNVPINSFIRQLGLTPPHGHRNAASSATRPPTSGNPQASEDQRRQITAGEVITNGIGIRSNSPNATEATVFHTATFRNSSCTTPPPSVVASTIANSHRNLETNLGNMKLFPCSNPVNPHMRSEESRLQTFLDHSSSWPAHRIRATPRQIANAGMYYLGVRDRVKCWYCNGGLQNWERDDDPWEEHAKWFPMCEFVLQQKGPDYVHGIVSRFPNLRRPIIRNPANPTAQLRYFQSESRGNPNAGPTIIDPREEARSLERRIDEEMSSSELIEQARQFGFDESVIRTSLKRKYEATGNGFSSLEIFVESILAMEEESASNRSEEGRSTSATAEATPTTSASDLSTTSGLQEIRRLQEERMCKVCGNEQAIVVLIPCGHIACCVGCAENASTCPICRSLVRERIRSFISTNEAGHDDEKERMCTNCGEDVARQRLIPRAQFDCCDRCDQRFSAEPIFRVRVDLN
ncbi:baculoviral IAP repeat-containing protein 7-like isoform X2 [Clavelina lepadiformis]|uniref:baculoviral IAP repeat-containing protein 7-like isoform X2 n=1 Tax=Clavelina lepadiformis TaxID=159417 RepID=UPI004041FB09